MALPREFLTPETMAKIFEQCNSQACLDAHKALSNARNDVLQWCQVVSAAQGRRDAYAAAAAATLVAAATAFAASAAATATIFGIPLGVVLFWIGVALLVVAAVLAVLAAIAQADLNNANTALGNARQAFTTAASDVTSKCSIYCWGDLTQPACP